MRGVIGVLCSCWIACNAPKNESKFKFQAPCSFMGRNPVQPCFCNELDSAIHVCQYHNWVSMIHEATHMDVAKQNVLCIKLGPLSPIAQAPNISKYRVDQPLFNFPLVSYTGHSMRTSFQLESHPRASMVETSPGGLRSCPWDLSICRPQPWNTRKLPSNNSSL